MRLDYINNKYYTWVGVAVGAGTAIYGVVKSEKAKSQAKKLAANRPKLQESPYTQEELALTKSQLANGMSGAASNAYEQGLDRDLSTSLGTILQGGGDMNNVAELFDRSQVGRQRLALMKENLRMNNLNNYINSLRLATNEDQNQFKFNEWAPWADQAQAVAQARASGEELTMNGISSAAAAGARGIAAKQRKNDFLKYGQGVNPNTEGGAAALSGWLQYMKDSPNQQQYVQYRRGNTQMPSTQVAQINPAPIYPNSATSPMAQQNPYLSPNYANNPFWSSVNAANFDYDNGETPVLFQKF